MHPGSASLVRGCCVFLVIQGLQLCRDNRSQKSGAKVKLVRLTFATRRGPDAGSAADVAQVSDFRDPCYRER